MFFSKPACRTSVYGFLCVLTCSVKDLGDKVAKVEALKDYPSLSTILNAWIRTESYSKFRELIDAVFGLML